MKIPFLSPKFSRASFRAGPALIGLSLAAMSLTSCTTEEGVVAGALAGAAIGGVIGHANEHDRHRYYRRGYYDHGYYHNDYYYRDSRHFRPGRRVYYRPGRYRHFR